MARQNLTLGDLLKFLPFCWDAQTSSDPDNWEPDENPAWGQCAVTALVVQDHLGGEILRASLEDVAGYSRLRSHYWNELPSGDQIDFTQSQFSVDAYKAIPEGSPSSREYLLSNEDTKRRYVSLVVALEKFATIKEMLGM